MYLEKTKRILSDSKHALKAFDNEPVCEDFRLAVILNMALIRAVGQVLCKEVRLNPSLSNANKKIFDEKKNDQIFICFIKEFRDNALKEYSAAVSWSSITVQATKAHRMEYLITEGAYKGQSFPKMIQCSIEWWEQYINEVIALAASYSPQK